MGEVDKDVGYVNISSMPQLLTLHDTKSESTRESVSFDINYICPSSSQFQGSGLGSNNEII